MVGMSTLVVNELDAYAIARAREAMAGGSIDAKRPGAYEVYGYPQQVTFERLLQAYKRGGAAHGAVHRLLDGCWQSLPRIKRPDGDEVSEWETRAAAVLKACGAWAKLRELDRRNLIGRYAAVIYRVADGRRPSEPLQRAARLVDLVPLFEDQIRVTGWHSDPADADNYGKPSMFQYQSRRLDGDKQGQPVEWLDVHPSRVQILAEGAVGDDFFDGVPLLESGFNALVDLEKISGGSAESYLKNSARTLAFEYDKDVSLAPITKPDGSTVDPREMHLQRVRDLNRNIDAAIVMQGGKAGVLQTSIADPSKPFEVAANLFAASVRIPFVVLFGQQTGRLASDQDRVEMAARCASRQANDLTPMIEQFVKRMQSCGVIEAGEFVVEWPPVNAPSEKDRLELLKGYTAAMREAFGAGLPPLFEPDELRRVVGFEPLEDPPEVREDTPPAED